MMLTVGALGTACWVGGRSLPGTLDGTGWLAWWVTTAFLSLIAAGLLVRRQALVNREPFWTPPTRQIVRAMAPALIAGGLVGLGALLSSEVNAASWLPQAWGLSYSVALCQAGAHAPRGLTWFGWALMAATALLILGRALLPGYFSIAPHDAMGLLFSLPHLLYGIYLRLTESRN